MCPRIGRVCFDYTPLQNVVIDAGALTEENLLFLEAWRTIDRAYVDKTFNGQSWFRYRENALHNEPMNTREETCMLHPLQFVIWRCLQFIFLNYGGIINYCVWACMEKSCLKYSLVHSWTFGLYYNVVARIFRVIQVEEKKSYQKYACMEWIYHFHIWSMLLIWSAGFYKCQKIMFWIFSNFFFFIYLFLCLSIYLSIYAYLLCERMVSAWRMSFSVLFVWLKNFLVLIIPCFLILWVAFKSVRPGLYLRNWSSFIFALACFSLHLCLLVLHCPSSLPFLVLH